MDFGIDVGSDLGRKGGGRTAADGHLQDLEHPSRMGHPVLKAHLIDKRYDLLIK